ncbi:polyadenylation and cleavage factor homolog 11-like isoform X2 [Euwallacea fornicatus]|uniref:polyadenylation and cleavage factor homolog 11-like isoform X2 n=1 Tax=Euwallacea fornicatus TaxID=995702 RepID=UPI00338FC3FE
MTTPEVIKAEYMSSLADLTFNSKHLINVLTMLAEENLPNAKIIVQAIEEHLAKVAVDVKLPILYLVDCIVKNVGQMYTSIFSQNIASTFCTVFKVVDEKTRLEMFKLRQTWNDVFPQMKLYAIDVQIHQIDPAWPVTAQPANNINLNSRFLINSTCINQANNSQKTEPSATPGPVSVKPALSAISAPSADMETLLMQEQLIQKQKELLVLQRKTLELEVLQTQVKLQEQIKAGGRRPPISTNILLKPEVANQLIPEVVTNKVKPSDIEYRSYSQPKIKPVNPALPSTRPSRDPRLIRRQQQQKLEQVAQEAPVVTTTSSVHDQKVAVLESNKNLHNKSSVRDIPRDPRLTKRGHKKSKFLSKSREPFSDQKSRNVDKLTGAFPKLNPNSSNSLPSGDLDSPLKIKRLPDKHRKREKPREFDGASSSKRGKMQNSNKEARKEESLQTKNEVPDNFVKSVENTNWNYVGPNLAGNTASIEDEDLRLASTSSQNDNSIKVNSESVAPKQKSLEPPPPHMSSSLKKPMDVDLRPRHHRLSPTLPKKRTSPEVSDQPSKKSRSFDVLFGSEDTDLRQIAVQAEEARENGVVDRPTTPPPPIISAEKSIENSVRRALPASPIRSDLDAVRAKLANVTNRDKVLSRPSNFEVSNVISQSLVAAPTTGGYQVQLPPNLPSTTAPQVPAMPLLNINELFQKLVASGVVKTQEKPQGHFQESAPIPLLTHNRVSERAPAKPHQQKNRKPQRRKLPKILKPLTFNKPETLKIRQEALYNTMYTGMQCSSCGMRFPLEASMWYSQHLDWHFRQNRRGKKNSRVANSRKWYYSLKDWKNYEELEDIEEREKNYFDQQQQQAEVADEIDEEIEIPTVSADPKSTDEHCYMCRDTFEQFFNEEKEEWHLRNAIRMEDKTYHPACYEDYQKSILNNTLNDSKNEEEDSQNDLIPGLEIALDDKDDDEEIVSLIDDAEEVPEDALSPAKEEEVAPEDDGDDDDVILNEVAPVRIVVDDDDDEVPLTENNEPVVIKQEKLVLDDDGFMDVDEIITLKEIGQVKIKSEPVEDDFRVADIEHNSDKRTEDEDLIKVTPCEKNFVPVTSHLQLITSMDGNIELSAPTNAHSTISGGNKIKINISKPLPVITPKETSETGDNSDVIVKASEIPMEELDILNYKPALQNVPLKKLPPVQKCTELTGLCSIM